MIATELNERQRVILLAAYDEDQAREARYSGPGGSSVRLWRWIKYGPVGHKWLDGSGHHVLRTKLAEVGLVNQCQATPGTDPFAS
ncbi:hypothetical protein [Methylobacterium sp. Gmos1]